MTQWAKTCETCAWWRESGYDGCCHRYPPSWSDEDEGPNWPKCFKSDFCGEWTADEAEEVTP